MINVVWLAGFFDGEGCVYISKKCTYMQVCITQKNPESLYLIQQEFGGKVNKHGTCYRWRSAHREVVLKLLTAIQPHCIVKASDVAIGIEYIKTVNENTWGHVPVPKEHMETRNRLRVLIGDGKRTGHNKAG